jgi:hypothetical protein
MLMEVIAFSFIAAIYSGVGWAAVFVWRNERELKRRGYKG